MALITDIKPQRNKLDRVNIYLDDEFFCAMQNFVCVKYGLKVNQNVEPEYLLKLTLESDKEKAMNKVAKYISVGLKTEKQVLDYLKKQGYDNQISDYVYGKLKEYNYLNDEHYVKSYINSYKHKYGKKKIEYELINKGIDKEIINTALSDFSSNQEAIIKLALKYIKGRELTYELQQKLFANLASKGFSFDEINKSITKIKENNFDD